MKTEQSEALKVRIIIKRTDQPPIDTPAMITWVTVDVDSAELARALRGTRYTSCAVVGAEVLVQKES